MIHDILWVQSGRKKNFKIQNFLFFLIFVENAESRRVALRKIFTKSGKTIIWDNLDNSDENEFDVGEIKRNN
jgi:hypothetical protein